MEFLQDSNVSVRSFPGATSEDMLDYCKPLINKKPDVFILHVGTNDLTKKVNNTKENIVNILKIVKEVTLDTEVVLSDICLREDIKDINGKRLNLNKVLRNICKENGLRIIDNSNIDSSCLARKKLHLNMRTGISRLAKNFKNFLQH